MSQVKFNFLSHPVPRNLLYHKFATASLIILLACLIATLAGSFWVGDSIRQGLKQIAQRHAASVDYLLQVPDGFVTYDLSQKLNQHPKLKAAGALVTSGSLYLKGGSLSFPFIQVLGIDEGFLKLSNHLEHLEKVKGGKDSPKLSSKEKEIIANHLKDPGDRVRGWANQKLIDLLETSKSGPSTSSTSSTSAPSYFLRLPKKGYLPLGVVWGRTKEDTVSLPLKEIRLFPVASLRDFQLENSPGAVPTLFVPLKTLQALFQQEANINSVLVQTQEEVSRRGLGSLINDIKTFADLGFYYDTNLAHHLLVKNHSLFLSDEVVSKILGGFPQAQPHFTWLVNKMTHGHTTPYSMVSGTTAFDLNPAEIAIHPWLADSEKVKVGDTLDLEYFFLNPNGELSLSNHSFTVAKILRPQETFPSSLMPDFPGLSEMESTANWSPGFEVDFSLIRDKDEQYWKEHRGSPKAFIPLETSKSLWKNPYGHATSIAIPLKGGAPAPSTAEIVKKIAGVLDFQDVGWRLLSHQNRLLRGSEGSVDFSQLFLSLGFFLILSLYILCWQFISGQREKRKGEYRLQSLMGFRALHLAHRFRLELLVIFLLALPLGVLMGYGYNRLLLFSLNSIWKGALITQTPSAAIQPQTLIIVLGLSVAVLLSLLLQSSYSLKKKLLQEHFAFAAKAKPQKSPRAFFLLWGKYAPVVMVLIFLGQVSQIAFTSIPLTPAVYVGSSLGFLLFFFLYLNRRWSSGRRSDFVFRANRQQNLTVAMGLTLAIFLIITVSGNKKVLPATDLNPSGPRGGFSQFIELSLPLPYKVLSELELPPGVHIHPLPKVSRDDASCLNINQANKPSILGISPMDFHSNNRLTIIDTTYALEGSNGKAGWLKLQQRDLGYLPAFIDQNVLQWGIKKSLGEVLVYSNRRGKAVPIKIVGVLNNTIFQGSLLVDGEQLFPLFPEATGYQTLLVSGRGAEVKELGSYLDFRLRKYGPRRESSLERLNRFYGVENTYLAIFGYLGMAAILIGLVTFSVLISKSLNDNKSQLKMMKRLGFSNRSLKKMLWRDYGEIMFLAIIGGSLASFSALVPPLKLGLFPYTFFFSTFFLLLIISSLAIVLPVNRYLRLNDFNSLRYG